MHTAGWYNGHISLLTISLFRLSSGTVAVKSSQNIFVESKAAGKCFSEAAASQALLWLDSLRLTSGHAEILYTLGHTPVAVLVTLHTEQLIAHSSLQAQACTLLCAHVEHLNMLLQY